MLSRNKVGVGEPVPEKLMSNYPFFLSSKLIRIKNIIITRGKDSYAGQEVSCKFIGLYRPEFDSLPSHSSFFFFYSLNFFFHLHFNTCTKKFFSY